jgi:hypothetical protein
MILYHGSNCVIDKVDLGKCRPFKDFGRGFYTTELKEQALTMARRTARMFGGSPVMNEFVLDESIFSDETIIIKNFSKPNIEWATFVINNRNKDYKDIASQDCNSDNKYDIVIGPVANDDIMVTLELYIDGRLTPNGLLEALEYKNLTQQTSFHSEKALSFLTRNY